MGKILAEIGGKIATLLAVYDEDFYNLLCDAQGHLQVDVLSSPLPTDAATETTLALVKDRIGALTSPASGSTNKLLTDALTALKLIDDLYGALHSQHTDELDVIVESSALPTDAATETTLDEIMDRLGDETSPASGSANAQLADIVARIGALSTPAGGSTNKLLTDALTALELIDNLDGALHSQNTDELVVRGEDQLFSYDRPLLNNVDDTISGAGGYIESGTPAANEVWIVTSVIWVNFTTATTRGQLLLQFADAGYLFHEETRATGILQHYTLQCEKYLEQNHTIRAYFVGGLAGDTVRVTLTGYIMTKET